MRACLYLALAALMLASPAWAQPAFVPLQQRVDPTKLADIGLSTAQLDALNRLLQDTEAAHPQTVPDAARASVPSAADASPRPAPMHIGLDEGPIKARATGTIAGWQPGTLFTLDNGQQWQVLKGQMTLRRAVQDPQIEVVPGIAGRWFLQVDPDLPKARVFRIR